MSRAKGSKIQNHVINVSSPAGNMPWYTELMALSKKDAATIATSIIFALEGFLDRAFQSGEKRPRVKVVHL
eukprot:2676219-Karenia_brevis.AAC.1